MAKAVLRWITVDGRRFGRRFVTRYATLNDSWGGHDTFVAYALASRRHPLRIDFRTWVDVTGDPLARGAVLLPDRPELGGANLHEPGWAAQLIRAGLRLGWDPWAGKGLAIADGMPLLLELLAANQTSGSGTPA